VPLPRRIPVTVVDNVIAGVEVDVATEPAKPLFVTTETLVTEPAPVVEKYKLPAPSEVRISPEDPVELGKDNGPNDGGVQEPVSLIFSAFVAESIHRSPFCTVYEPVGSELP